MPPAFSTLPQVVPYRLFRPETQYQDGKHVRDLSKLNRDLSQVCGLDSLCCESRCRPAVAQQETQAVVSSVAVPVEPHVRPACPPQVLFISADTDAYAFQPENTLKLKPWKDDPSDTTLLDLMPMLQMIALKGVKDVRDVVK